MTAHSIFKMKKGIIHIITTILLLTASACTQNHGYIGRLFGSWYLYEMTCDGEAVDIAQYGDAFWSFQSNLIVITIEYDHHCVSKSYGTWTETDGNLILDFSYTYEHGSLEDAYEPPVWMGLVKKPDNVLHYLEKSGKSMLLRFTDADGKVFEYYFRKTY